MTADQNDKGPKLGDLLAPDSDFLQKSDHDREIKIAAQPPEEDIEVRLVKLAGATGVDKAELLTEFRRGGPLAKIFRLIFNEPEDDRDEFWKAVDLVNQLRSQGMTLVAACEEAAKLINAPDAAGVRRRAVTASSIRQYYKEASALLKRPSLTKLYAPDGWRPPRRKKGNPKRK